MLLRDRTTGKRISWEELQAANPNTVVPKVLSKEALDFFSVDAVTPYPTPSFDPLREYVEPAPDELVNGVWYQAWFVMPNGRAESDIAVDEAAALLAIRRGLVASPWGIRRALNSLGLRAGVEAAVAIADQDTQDAWWHAQEFHRLNPLVVNIGKALGKTDEELDALFELAKSLSSQTVEAVQ